MSVRRLEPNSPIFVLESTAPVTEFAFILQLLKGIAHSLYYLWLDIKGVVGRKELLDRQSSYSFKRLKVRLRIG